MVHCSRFPDEGEARIGAAEDGDAQRTRNCASRCCVERRLESSRMVMCGYVGIGQSRQDSSNWVAERNGEPVGTTSCEAESRRRHYS